MRQPRSTRSGGRPAFTLVELLVVISILAVLAALGAAVTIRFIGVQESRNTQTTLTTLQSRLDDSWAAVKDEAMRETISPADKARIDPYVGSPPDPNRRRVIWLKARQKQAFPINFVEALNPAPLPPLSSYVAELQRAGITVANAGDPAFDPFESSVCLLMALKREVGGAGIRPEDLGGAVKEFELPNGRTIEGIVDGHDRPLYFCRWATGFAELTGPVAGMKDPADPQGWLTHAAWLPSSISFQNQFHPLPARTAAGGPQSFLFRPVIVSSGPDKKLGQDPRTLTPLGPDADDNVYSVEFP